MLRGVSPFWTRAFRVFYWFTGRMAPVVRPIVRRVGLGNVVELEVTGRLTGRRRDVLLGLLQVDGEWYLGHPNGASGWTRNLDAARTAGVVFRKQPSIRIRPALLAPGDERDRVIAATWRQHVFPGSVIYWLARRHIRAVGRYYRVEPIRDAATS